MAFQVASVLLLPENRLNCYQCVNFGKSCSTYTSGLDFLNLPRMHCTELSSHAGGWGLVLLSEVALVLEAKQQDCKKETMQCPCHTNYA